MKTRVLTAAILIPLVLGMVASASSLWIAVVACLAAGISCDELARLQAGSRRLAFPFPILAACVLVYFLLPVASGMARSSVSPAAFAQLLALTLTGCLVAALWVKNGARILFEVGALWCTAPLISLVLLHRLYTTDASPWGWSPVLFALIPLWFGDSLAYFIGRKFGKRLLAPTISPKKTVEGGVANLVGCVLGGLATAALLGAPASVGGALGMIAGVLGQVGDLYESGLKRAAGAKDSGALLPGHGGLLDRIDSLLLAAPVQALALALFWPPR